METACGGGGSGSSSSSGTRAITFDRVPSELLAGRVRPQEASGVRRVSALLIAALRSTIAGNACVVASGPGRMLAKMDMRATRH